MKGPYRTAHALAKPAPPRTLECWLRDGDKGRWLRRVYVKLSLTTTACIMMAFAGAHLAAIPAGLIGLLWAINDIRKRKGAGVVLSVERSRLRIALDTTSEPIEVDLDEVLEVRLDTKGESRNMTLARADGVNTIFGSPGHNIDVNVSRIEVVLDEDDPIVLSPDFISTTLCTESLRSIRLFLRSHGWKPEDEREPDPE